MQSSRHTRPIAKELVERINFLMDNPPFITNTNEMKNQLVTYVRDKYGDSIPTDNKSYYPSEKTVSTAIQRNLSRMRFAKCDQENVQALSNKWKADKPGSLVYFRSRTESGQDVDELGEGSHETDDVVYNMKNRKTSKRKNSNEKNMLFVHINEDQLHLWKRYGKACST